MKDYQKQLCTKAAQALQKSHFAIAMTGAGISVPSGIPDFRSPGGLWSKFDPESVCSEWALRNNQAGVWEFLLDAVKMFAQAKPNPAHRALAGLEDTGIIKAVITQNIDNLHQEAGSKEVVEFHGGCGSFFCNSCAKTYPSVMALDLTKNDIPWLCMDCQGIIRPAVVFFGESIPEQAMYKTREYADKTDLVVIIGTSGEVAPANIIPTLVKNNGGTVIEINLGSTAYDGLSDIKLDMPAEIALPEILSKIEHHILTNNTS
ncbi:NAD-dependent deacylase [Desulfonatronovibrio magnus]|uniref:NAD-dependent deacylase n=1 Tax=Desulfonatronovibrio magnus TaxID=698827 RepID=UPI0005EADEC3|nr:NAD-dependent deacylase [Desulfonatronovibrio magnus]